MINIRACAWRPKVRPTPHRQPFVMDPKNGRARETNRNQVGAEPRTKLARSSRYLSISIYAKKWVISSPEAREQSYPCTPGALAPKEIHRRCVCALQNRRGLYANAAQRQRDERGAGRGGGMDDGGGCWLLFLFVCAGVRALRGMGRQAVRQNKNRKG